MTLTLTLKGFDYTSYYNGGFENADSLPSLVSTDANSVALTTDWGINAETSQIYADPSYTDSLTVLGDTIKEAESLGLSVMVRPLIDLVSQTLDGNQTGDWRDTYVPNNTAAFFSSYETMIVAEASIAQEDGAQSLCIGAEIDDLCGTQYLSNWTTIIDAVRAVYSGKLTYSANWDDDISPWTYSGAPAGTGNLATQISFWNQLDYIGIDEYAPISDATNPTLSQLIHGWTETPTDTTTDQVTGGESLIKYFENVATEIGKPLIFTEIGYQNATDGALAQPNASGTEDDALQGSLYTAFFDAWSSAGDSALTGVYFWNWDPNASEVGPGQINWSPQDLPAQEAVTAGFESAMACYAGGTRIRTLAGDVPVEQLCIGDWVVTASGVARPIKWIGRRSYDGRFIADNRDILPIVIRAGALAEGVPSRDLTVSPRHAMFIDALLIPAELLINGRSIVQREQVAEITYFHIELESHDVLLAEGAPAESFVDCDSRGMFQNAAEFALLYPEDQSSPWTFCAPRVEDGEALACVRRRLAARAGLAADHVADAARPGVLDGRIDLCDAESIAGWAFDAARPHTPVRLEIIADGVVVADVVANGLREDVERAGLGGRRCGFAHRFAPALSAGCDHVVEVRRVDDGAGLPCGAMKLAPGPFAPGPFDGCVDRCGPASVEGWAFDSAWPERAVEVEIMVDGAVVGRVMANNYRLDLERAGKGRGLCGFVFRPGQLPAGWVEVRRASDGAVVPGPHAAPLPSAA